MFVHCFLLCMLCISNMGNEVMYITITPYYFRHLWDKKKSKGCRKFSRKEITPSQMYIRAEFQASKVSAIEKLSYGSWFQRLHKVTRVLYSCKALPTDLVQS